MFVLARGRVVSFLFAVLASEGGSVRALRDAVAFLFTVATCDRLRTFALSVA